MGQPCILFVATRIRSLVLTNTEYYHIDTESIIMATMLTIGKILRSPTHLNRG